MKHDVFISYSSNDKEIAFQICLAIEKSGLVCWIAPRDVMPGAKYAKEIVGAIQNCSIMLLVFSESSNKSEHVENEIDIAFNEGKTIIPFKITDTEMSAELKYYLNKKHWVDGLPEPESHFEKLVEQISLSIPHRSKELKEDELFKGLHKMLDEYQDNNADIIEDKMIFLRKKLEEVLRRMEARDIEGEGRYDIMQNGDGEVLIIINVKPGEPDNPRFVYDGGSDALLYRNTESSIMLTSIAKEAGSAIQLVDEVLVAEIKDDDIFREYMVPVRNVKSLDHLLKLAKDKIE